LFKYWSSSVTGVVTNLANVPRDHKIYKFTFLRFNENLEDSHELQT
jgi:hypothetical protein